MKQTAFVLIAFLPLALALWFVPRTALAAGENTLIAGLVFGPVFSSPGSGFAIDVRLWLIEILGALALTILLLRARFPRRRTE